LDGRCSANVVINRLVIVGASMALPFAASRTALTRSRGGVSFSRNPDAPARRARWT